MLVACGAALRGGSCGAGAIAGIGRVVARSAVAAPFSSTTAAADKVGFIGLGRIGSRLVPRLLDGGHEVVLHDANSIAVKRVREEGARHPRGSVTIAESPAGIAATEGVSAVITSLPDPAALLNVFTGDRGLLTPRDLAEHVAATRLAAGAKPLTASGRPALLDAPATGGVVAAEAGTLTFCVGAADEKDLEAARPLLALLGGHVTFCGPVGAGSVAKLCNTLVMGSTMAAVSEALALGRRLGVDPAVLTDVLNSGSGQCWAAERYNPAPGVVKGAPSNAGYKPGQAVDQVRDQLLMLINAGDRCHSPTPVAEFCEKEYRLMHDEGLGDKDFSAIYRYRYGSGCDNPEWKEGQQLFSSQVP